jgi:hypothetical protein
MFLYKNMPADGHLSSFFNLVKLGAQSINKIFQPAGHIHIGFADALDGLVKSWPSPSADCSQTFGNRFFVPDMQLLFNPALNPDRDPIAGYPGRPLHAGPAAGYETDHCHGYKSLVL